MVASEHPDVIERRWWFIATDFIDSDEADYYGSVDNYCADSCEEDKSGLGEAGVKTGVT